MYKKIVDLKKKSTPLAYYHHSVLYIKYELILESLPPPLAGKPQSQSPHPSRRASPAYVSHPKSWPIWPLGSNLIQPYLALPYLSFPYLTTPTLPHCTLPNLTYQPKHPSCITQPNQPCLHLSCLVPCNPQLPPLPLPAPFPCRGHYPLTSLNSCLQLLFEKANPFNVGFYHLICFS
jgi:hypothetical protein